MIKSLIYIGLFIFTLFQSKIAGQSRPLLHPEGGEAVEATVSSIPEIASLLPPTFCHYTPLKSDYSSLICLASHLLINIQKVQNRYPRPTKQAAFRTVSAQGWVTQSTLGLPGYARWRPIVTPLVTITVRTVAAAAAATTAAIRW